MAKYKLGDIAPIKQGVAPDEFPCWLLNLDMVESNTGRIIEYLYVQRDEIGSSTVAFDTNNVLYSKLRPYLNKVVLPDRSGYATSEMLPLMPDKAKITREYLTCFLRSSHFVGYIKEKTSGAKMPRANTDDLKSVEIDCPSIEQQKAIVGVIERLSHIIDLYQHQLHTLDQLVKARFVEMFGEPHRSIIYPYLKVSELTDVVSGGTPDRKNADYWNEGTIPWVKTTELQNNVITVVEERITEKGLSESSAKIIPANTVLIAMYGQGKTRGMTGFLGIEACTNQACACLLPTNDINMQYLWHYLILSYDELRGLAQGGNQPNLNAGMIKDFPILVPPTEMQKQFVYFVSQVDNSKLSIQASLDQLETLKQSLMQEYFG